MPISLPISTSLPSASLLIDTSGTAFGGTPTWTDYTAYLLLAGRDGKPISVTWGRQDETAEPSPRQCSFLLKNTTAVWTPGNAAAPAGWDVGARIRVQVTVGGNVYDRFDGYVDSILPTWPGGVETWNVVEVSATDITARLNIGQPLRSMVEQEILADAPVAYYPLTEDQGATSAGDISGNAAQSLTPADSKYGAGSMTFGAEGTTGEVSAVQFVPGESGPAASTVLGNDGGMIPLAAPFSLEFWFVIDELVDSGSGVPSYVNSLLTAGLNSGYLIKIGVGDPNNFTPGELYVTMQNRGAGLYSTASIGFTSGARVDDKKWHQAVITVASDDVSGSLYLDGQLVATHTSIAPFAFPAFQALQVGGYLSGKPIPFSPTVPLNGRMGHVAFYDTELSPARVLDHYGAGSGTLLERTDERYARIAAYAGIATTALPTGRANVMGQLLSDKSVTEALATVARTEGTVSFVTGSGQLTFQPRDLRYDPTDTLALTADDVDGDVAFRRDRQGFANEYTVTRQGGAAQRVIDQASQNTYGRFDGGSLDVASATDYDALQLATWFVSLHKDPQTRTPSLGVDLLSQPSIAVIEDVLDATISTQVTVTALPSQAPASSVTLFVEGGSELIGPQEWNVGFFTSPALPFLTLRADGSPSARTKLDNGLKIAL